jgi:hypothetical protein
MIFDRMRSTAASVWEDLRGLSTVMEAELLDAARIPRVFRPGIAFDLFI